MEEKWSQAERLLYMFTELNKGNVFTWDDHQEKFDVSRSSFDKDIKKLRQTIHRLQLGFDIEEKNSEYRIQNSMDKELGLNLSDAEAYALAKILIESRALSKSQTTTIIQKLINRTVNEVDRDNLKSQSKSELAAFEELDYFAQKKDQDYLNRLLVLSRAIDEAKTYLIPIKMIYGQKQTPRLILPMAIHFHEFYFYVRALEYKEDNWQTRTYRLDRIASIEEASGADIKRAQETIQVSQLSATHDGQVVMMYSGKPYLVRFRVQNRIKQLVKDALPGLTVVEENEVQTTFEIKTSGFEGIQLFLRRYGNDVEFVSMVEVANK